MSTVSSVSGDEKPERKKKKKIFSREKWNYSTTAQPPPHAYAHTAVHVHKHTTTHRYFISYFLVIPKKTPVSIATVGIHVTSVEYLMEIRFSRHFRGIRFLIPWARDVFQRMVEGLTVVRWDNEGYSHFLKTTVTLDWIWKDVYRTFLAADRV